MRHGLLVAVIALAVTACEREERKLKDPAGSVLVQATPMVSLHPGEVAAPRARPRANPAEPNAQAIADGKRLFQWFNCVGCHSNGGGGMGPPLMDERWIYGSAPENIYDTIAEGRPNGMPSFAGKISEADAWKLVAYVRSMSGLVPRDALPARGDHSQLANPETPYRTPVHRQPAEHP
jgi:cytochrome c oxidase cbb3-type subunit III